MSGITHESRLERLLALRDQIDTEIAAERDVEKTRRRNLAEKRAKAEADRRQARRDSVSHQSVRSWAMAYGHDYPSRGRVPDSLIDLYLGAHPEHRPTRHGRGTEEAS